ncbi:hypothetical protein C7476_117103 [Phyllobacterium bourgognense]|uniref:Uncharacterized protein n=1 Tax=Phyllobacterium bourgognense TaxID=314236 RepID=A0A368YJE4_9HYPH|nr:hypothetical protein C7476_117103 [Phyllobacterium bourgognense]
MLLQTGECGLASGLHTRTLRHEIGTASGFDGALLRCCWLLGGGGGGEKTGHTKHGYQQAASAACTSSGFFEHRTSPWGMRSQGEVDMQDGRRAVRYSYETRVGHRPEDKYSTVLRRSGRGLGHGR